MAGQLAKQTVENKKEEVTLTLIYLGFYLDLDRWEEKGWMRFEHPVTKDNSDFALLVSKNDELSKLLMRASNMLRKIGQYQKIQQIHTFL